jgi:hypothetical protein
VQISRECTPQYLSTGISNLLQPAQAEVVLGQCSTYLASWAVTGSAAAGMNIAVSTVLYLCIFLSLILLASSSPFVACIVTENEYSGKLVACTVTENYYNGKLVAWTVTENEYNGKLVAWTVTENEYNGKLVA